MAFLNMTQEMLGIPGMNFALAQTKLNEALGLIFDEQLWSFQLKESGWLTPGLVVPSGTGGGGLSVGSITVTPFTTTVTGDAIASAAWIALIGRPFITELQIRSPFYSLYSIVAMDTTVPTAAVLTLDRPWMEPALANGSYMIYQAYFPVPVPDFKKFMWARDPTNNTSMDYWTYTQKDLAAIDSERTVFDEPRYIVPYQTDQRPGSATLGNMLYELWPHPLSRLPYTYGYMRTGPLLKLPTDTVIYPLTEDLVKHRAYAHLYAWKESQRGNEQARGSGTNWLQLAAYHQEQYKNRKKAISLKDQMIVDNYWNKWRPSSLYGGDPYATITGGLNVGRF